MLKQKIKLKKCYKKNLILKLRMPAKILQFKAKNSGILSDEDINSLFLGVLNLIKTNAIKKAELALRREVAYYQELLSLNLSKVVKLEKELKRLKEQNN